MKIYTSNQRSAEGLSISGTQNFWYKVHIVSTGPNCVKDKRHVMCFLADIISILPMKKKNGKVNSGNLTHHEQGIK